MNSVQGFKKNKHIDYNHRTKAGILRQDLKQIKNRQE